MMQVTLIAITQPLIPEIKNQEQLIEYAGRKCTNTCVKTGANTAQFVRARIKQGHTSILEHINFTFEIDGISRACLAQLTRHRIASYSVQSLRYVKHDGTSFVTPQAIADNPFLKMVFDNALKYLTEVYHKLIENGVRPEDARFILPLATQTNLIMTINLRSLLNLFELRLNNAAQWEIRELANAIKEIVIEYCPFIEKQ